MAKIAISLPEETLQAVEKERLANGLSRSEFFRRAVEEHLRRVKEREDVEQYIQAYLKYPETTEEIALAEATQHYAFDGESWEDDWKEASKN
jgi:metal-responsive CopG/Arc/MetJ family transcriptional regulator